MSGSYVFPPVATASFDIQAWTPDMGVESGGGTGFTLVGSAGTFWRSGPLVFFAGSFTVSVTAGAGIVSISGLPFIPTDVAVFPVEVTNAVFRTNVTLSPSQVTGRFTIASTNTTDSGVDVMTVADITAPSDIAFSGWMFV